MEDFVRKTKGVRDITSLPLDTSHELDIVSDVKGKIYIKILNRYRELLFDNGTDQWVIDMLNNLEVDVEQLKEDILDVEQTLTELPMIEDKLETVETKLAQINTLFAQMQIDVQGLDLRTAELEREVVQLALKDQELLDKINNLDIDVDLNILYSNSTEFGEYDYSGNPNIAPVINDDNVKALSNTMTTVINRGTYATAEKIGNGLTVGVGMFPWSRYDFMPLTVGKQYTLTIPIRINADYTGDISKLFIRIRCSNTDGSVLVNTKMLPSNTPKEELVNISTTFTVPSTVQNSNNWYCQVGSSGDSDGRGTVDIGYDVKLEEGSTATPYQPNLLEAPYYLSKVDFNDKIPYYKYFGINTDASKNPNDYQWISLSKTAETVDARLTKTISTYDTVNALQNNRLTALESKVVDTTWQNVTPTEPFTSVTQPQVKKQNGIVYMRGTISNGTGDCFTLPEGFRPPAGAYEMQFRLPCRSANAADYATIYVRPSGLCSIAGVNGTKPIFLSGIIFSTT
jgi:hypothetical protein